MKRYLHISIFITALLFLVIVVFSMLNTTRIQTIVQIYVWFFFQMGLYGMLFFCIQKLSKVQLPFEIEKAQFSTVTMAIVGIILLVLSEIGTIFYDIFFQTLNNSSNLDYWQLLRLIFYFVILLWFFHTLKKSVGKQTPKVSKFAFALSVLVILFHVLVFERFSTIISQWHSTLFVWYMLSAMLASGSAFIVIYLLYLQKNKLLELTASYKNDISKFLFAFSILWAYMWYEQYMISWQANIPSETDFYLDRFTNLPLFYVIFFVMGFIVPFILLLGRKMKENNYLMMVSSVSVLIAHIFELYFIFNIKIIESINNVLIVEFILIFFILFLFLGMFHIKFQKHVFVFLLFLFVSCTSEQTPGKVYYPDMFYSSTDTSNAFKPASHVKGSIHTRQIYYRFEKDNIERIEAGNTYISPIVPDSLSIASGKDFYNKQCLMCHGSNADGKGFLFTSGKYSAAPRSLLTPQVQQAPDGELFHVMTVGFNLMMPHGKFLSTNERWHIVTYIKSLGRL